MRSELTIVALGLMLFVLPAPAHAAEKDSPASSEVKAAVQPCLDQYKLAGVTGTVAVFVQPVGKEKARGVVVGVGPDGGEPFQSDPGPIMPSANAAQSRTSLSWSVHQFRPLAEAETRRILQEKWQPPDAKLPDEGVVEEEAIASILRITGGNFRLAKENLGEQNSFALTRPNWSVSTWHRARDRTRNHTCSGFAKRRNPQCLPCRR